MLSGEHSKPCTPAGGTCSVKLEAEYSRMQVSHATMLSATDSWPLRQLIVCQGLIHSAAEVARCSQSCILSTGMLLGM